MPKHPATKILSHFFRQIDRLWGLHLDAGMAFDLFGHRLKQLGVEPNKGVFIYDGPDEDPNHDDATYQHSVFGGDLIKRNERDGDNQRLLSVLIIVLIYAIWDTDIRPRYAEALGQKQGDVKSDLFGDLRLYRHGIIHNNFALERPTKVLDLVKVGEPVLLKHAQLRQLIAMLYAELSNINAGFTGEALPSPFERRLNREGEFPKRKETNGKVAMGPTDGRKP